MLRPFRGQNSILVRCEPTELVVLYLHYSHGETGMPFGRTPVCRILVGIRRRKSKTHFTIYHFPSTGTQGFAILVSSASWWWDVFRHAVVTAIMHNLKLCIITGRICVMLIMHNFKKSPAKNYNVAQTNSRGWMAAHPLTPEGPIFEWLPRMTPFPPLI
jgi:hypothetical protein